MEPDVTLVTISCFTLRWRGETPQVHMRTKGTGEEHVIPVFVFLRTVSGSCGVRSRGTGTPRLSKH